MFTLLLYNLRAQGVKVGLGEWMAFLAGIREGLVVDLEGLYPFGRAVLCQSEKQYDAWDVAFSATFSGVELPQPLSEAILEWLAEAQGEPREQGTSELSPDELRDELYRRLREQAERHDGGSRWVGTGGTSPFGNSGANDAGVRVGGESGGGRSAVRVAEERRWLGYRTDRALDVRDLQTALKALRFLAREGAVELDLDGTIQKTADNGGEIDLDWQRARQNRVHLALVMDTGGSMDPHTRLVERLFRAAKETRGFKTFQAWYFHNAPAGYLYRDYATWDRSRIEEVLREWTPQHRVVFVGDASMAPWELFGAASVDHTGRAKGLSPHAWLQAIRQRCRASVWLNPDPVKYWDHPTVSAIGATFPMYPLTLDGLRDAVRTLRAPA